MLNCHDATKLMSEALDRQLTIGERMPLKLHVMMCSGCRNFGKQMTMMRDAARTFAKGKRDSR
ncbi:MAG: zf-HC2 domain-containing protein [Steroidobacteraceae bacterium]